MVRSEMAVRSERLVGSLCQFLQLAALCETIRFSVILGPGQGWQGECLLQGLRCPCLKFSTPPGGGTTTNEFGQPTGGPLGIDMDCPGDSEMLAARQGG